MLKKVLILFLLPLFAFTVGHKFYVSVTNINYDDEDKALQITSRIFIDDLEKVLGERYGISAKLATDDESKIAQEYVEKYLKTKFLVAIDGETVTYDYLGSKYDKDIIICYVEVSNVDFSKISSVTVENEILTDLFDEQQNVVHFKYNGKKKSFVLMRGNTKGMLNL
ncbi:DUF6702 family protein [Costertonia aggregata]|uniref:Peptidase E n=1 Tax=Costertonia aggregata TaxID=343403 RepID=A0A7H9ALJ8_9FLAO|nr:DUF6702 family protein [Costertonia aggregata]QLG44319.1 hypothetical protein HYG79_02820 [Costertonia aggregata]